MFYDLKQTVLNMFHYVCSYFPFHMCNSLFLGLETEFIFLSSAQEIS